MWHSRGSDSRGLHGKLCSPTPARTFEELGRLAARGTELQRHDFRNVGPVLRQTHQHHGRKQGVGQERDEIPSLSGTIPVLRNLGRNESKAKPTRKTNRTVM